MVGHYIREITTKLNKLPSDKKKSTYDAQIRLDKLELPTSQKRTAS